MLTAAEWCSVVVLQPVTDSDMEDEASVSSSRVEDSLDSPSAAICDDQTRLDMDSTDRTSNESVSEQKLMLADSEGEGDGPAVKKPLRLEELLSTRSNEDVTLSVKEPKLEIEDGTRPTKEIKIEIDDSDEDENARPQSGSFSGSGDAIKKPRLESQSTPSVGGRTDRHRNKSTSAAVLLGLVKSRVRKLASERHETAAKTSSSDTAVSSSSSDTALTAASSLSATSSPKMKAPRGEC